MTLRYKVNETLGQKITVRRECGLPLALSILKSIPQALS